MSRLPKGQVEKPVLERTNTELVLDELRAKIQLAEYEHKATFEKCEQEKKSNFATLLSERRKNRLRLHAHGTSRDAHNIAYAYEKRRPAEKLYITKKPVTQAIQIQDNKVCEAIKKYNLKVHEKEQKLEQVKRLEEEIEHMKALEERRQVEEMNSPEMQQIRILENRFEKLKMKRSSALLISEHYHKILEKLNEDTQNFPWKLDELQAELLEYQKSLGEAVEANQDSQKLVEKSLQNTKTVQEEFFEGKKNRDKVLGNTRKDVDKAHKEVKVTDKSKILRGAASSNPMQEIINKEAEDSQVIQQRYEHQRKKRADYETTASLLKNACKVSSNEEILPAITQQHDVHRALAMQIESLENQKAVLEMEKQGVTKEYDKLKYYGEKKISEGMRRIEEESDTISQLKTKLQETTSEIKMKERLLEDVAMASNNFFMILQKYKIDPKARQMMTGRLDKDILVIMEKLEQVGEQIEPHGKVSEFLENSDFLDFMEDTLPKSNTRIEIRGDEEEGADVFEEDTAKTTSTVLTREDIKKASQRIIERNQGKPRRKKTK